MPAPGAVRLCALGILLPVLASGCVLTDNTCDRKQTIEASVDGVEGELTRLELIFNQDQHNKINRTQVRAMSCWWPDRQEIDVVDGEPVPTVIDSLFFNEVRITSTAGVVRIAAPLDRVESGPLRLDVDLRDRAPARPIAGQDPVVRWNGTRVEIRMTEVHPDPDALEGQHPGATTVSLADGENRTWELPVVTPWNRGITVTLSAGGEDNPRLQGAVRTIGAITVLAPDGTVASTEMIQTRTSGSFWASTWIRFPDTVGVWTVQVEMEDRGLGPYHAELTARVDY